MLVRDILKSKGKEVYSISPNKTVYDAIAKMDQLDIGALVVLNDQSLQGIISERDYRSKVILKGRTSKQTKVGEIMTGEVYCVAPTDTAEMCMSLMTEKKIRHLPVVDNNNVIGVVSIGDLVKAIISKQKVEISHMRNYIQGSYPT